MQFAIFNSFCSVFAWIKCMNVWESPGKLCLHLLGFILGVCCRKWLESESPPPERQKSFPSSFPLLSLPQLLPGTKQETSARGGDASGPSTSSPSWPRQGGQWLQHGLHVTPRNGGAEAANTWAMKHPSNILFLRVICMNPVMSVVYGPCVYIYFFFNFDWLTNQELWDGTARAQEWSSKVS